MIEQPETCDDCGEFTYDCKCENARLRKENTQLTATIASQLAEIERLRGEVEQERNAKADTVALLMGTAAMMLIEVERYWKFDNYQQHTHSWHCKQDCLELCRKMLEDMSHLAATDYAALARSMNELKNGNYRPVDEVIAEFAAVATPKEQSNDAE